MGQQGGVSAADAEMISKMAASGMSPTDIQAMLNSPKSKGMSPESKALMQQILASGASQDEVANRVAALLAGTALSSSRDFARADGTGVDAIGYETTNLSEARQRKDGFEMPEIHRGRTGLRCRRYRPWSYQTQELEVTVATTLWVEVEGL